MSGVSGDFYDFYETEEGMRGVGLFDVSGHGISSGLVKVIAKSVIARLFREMDEMGLNRVLAQVNTALKEEIGTTGHFLTGMLLRFSGPVVEYVNGGHPDLLLRRRSGKVTPVTKSDMNWKGMPLAVTDDEYACKVLQVNTKPGDTLLLYSDCILESQNPAREQFGMERLIESLAGAPSLGAREILDYINAEFSSFMRNTPLTDDYTVMVLRRI